MSNRRALVRIDLGLLAQVLHGHPLCAISSDFPSDAEIVGWEPFDFNTVQTSFGLVVESASFAEVPAGGRLPDFTPTYTPTMSEADGLLAAMRRCPECPNCTGPDHYDAVRGISR